MYCEYCTNHDAKTKWNFNKKYKNKKTNALEGGIRRFRIDGIRQHTLSDIHKTSIGSFHLSKNLSSGMANLFNKAYDDYKRIFKAARFITEQRLPCSKFVDLCEFLRSYRSYGIKLTNNDLYVTSYGYYEILKTFSETTLKNIANKIKKNKFYSIIVDESTDISQSKELIVYVKYFDDQTNEIYTQFLTLIRLNDFSALEMKVKIKGTKFIL